MKNWKKFIRALMLGVVGLIYTLDTLFAFAVIVGGVYVHFIKGMGYTDLPTRDIPFLIGFLVSWLVSAIILITSLESTPPRYAAA